MAWPRIRHRTLLVVALKLLASVYFVGSRGPVRGRGFGGSGDHAAVTRVVVVFLFVMIFQARK